MRFRPPWWAWIVTVLGVALFVKLSLWQWDKAQFKEQLVADRGQALSAAANLNAGGEPVTGKALKLVGRYLTERELILDNQVLAGEPGIHIWTPMVASHDRRVYLVNRGWLAWRRGAGDLPEWETPAGPITVYGQWRPLPEAGLRLGENPCPTETWPVTVQYPTVTELECLLERDLVDGVLLLHPEVPGGFDRNWPAAELPPERHIGYAFQWAALAVTAVVLFIVLNLRRRPVGQKT